MHSCLYEGRVRHRRYRPVRHAFEYRQFMLYLDLDELPTLFDRYWLWSNEGRGLARFRRRDHLKQMPPTQDLRDAVRDLVQRETGARPAGPIRLLTHLEYFRYRFNPVSFYFCFDTADAQVVAIVAEINNTPWREQHCYVLPAERNLAAEGAAAQAFELRKAFHISPFMGMDTDYRWHFTRPGRTLAIHMDNLRGNERYFDATMTLTRTDITAASLARMLLQYPLMTTKVIAAIHWQALWLWLKRCPYYPHPKFAPRPGSATP